MNSVNERDSRRRIDDLMQFNAQLKANLAHEDEKRRQVEDERKHLATMLEIAAGDAWHDSFTGDPEDDYAETWLICLGDRADKRDARKEERITP